MRITKQQILQLIDELENVGWNTKTYSQECSNEHCERTRTAYDKSEVYAFCPHCGYDLLTTTDAEDTVITLRQVFKKIKSSK